MAGHRPPIPHLLLKAALDAEREAKAEPPVVAGICEVAEAEAPVR